MSDRHDRLIAIAAGGRHTLHMRQDRPYSAIAALAVVLAASPAAASTSAWVEAEGGRVRLVSSGLPDAQGRLRAALQIALKPGWKTYWRDPGEAGVPPSLDASASPGVKSATLDFPAPERHHDGDYAWAGYGHAVSLPVSFEFASAGDPGRIDAAMFLGICETICVPVQADLSLTPADDAGSPQDASIVANAFDALPRPATETFGIRLAKADDDALVVEALLPDSEPAELFLAGEEGYTFGVPEPFEEDGRHYFRMSLTRPDATPSGEGLHYTLVTASGAVSGLLAFF